MCAPAVIASAKVIARDGKPGLADFVGCVTASTALGMTKRAMVRERFAALC
jgi:hypothetical protein